MPGWFFSPVGRTEKKGGEAKGRCRGRRIIRKDSCPRLHERRMKAKKQIAVAVLGTAIAGGLIAGTQGGVMAAKAPSAADRKSITVQNVQDGATVTAYRILEPTYNAYGFVRFSNISGIKLADPEKPTAAEITKIAENIASGALKPSTTVTMTGNEATGYTGSFAAGEYVVIVRNPNGNASYAYNPMVISSYYTDASDSTSLTMKTADAAGQFKELGGTGAVAYAKRTKIPMKKEIINPDGKGNSKGDELAAGDTGSFRLTSAIPSYSKSYTNPDYWIEDTQSKGLDPATDITVRVGGVKYDAGSTTFKVENGIKLDNDDNANDFRITFVPSFTMAHVGQEVTVDYKAKLNKNANEKLTVNPNDAKVTYSNDMYDGHHEETDRIREYSFPVAVKKVNEQDAPLQGAEFTLIRQNVAGGQAAHTETLATGADGRATFHHLDEGVYTIQETKAPHGYAINPVIYRLEVVPEYKDDGTLVKYTAKLTEQDSKKNVGEVVVANADADILAGNISDIRLQVLPGTGAKATKIAIVLAGTLGGIALTAFAIGKKKEEQKNAEESK